MRAFRAAWVVPIDRAPIADGYVEVAGGRIVGVGEVCFTPAPIDLGRVALMPGLVNTHTHLELSWMRGRVPPAPAFTEWVKAMFAVRGRPDAGMSATQVAAISDGALEARAAGTAAVGDISNSLASVGPLREAGLDGIVFHELLGFKERDGSLVERTLDQRTIPLLESQQFVEHDAVETGLSQWAHRRERIADITNGSGSRRPSFQGAVADGGDLRRAHARIWPAAHGKHGLHPLGKRRRRRHATAHPGQLEMGVGVDQAGHQRDAAQIDGCRGETHLTDADDSPTRNLDVAIGNGRAVDGHHPRRAKRPHATGEVGGCDRCFFPAALRAG